MYFKGVFVMPEKGLFLLIPLIFMDFLREDSAIQLLR